MAKVNFKCGIDIGTNFIKVVVVGVGGKKKEPSILATGISENTGMRLGYISNIEAASLSLRRAVSQAEKTLGQKIRKAFISIEGINLNSVISSGVVVASKADREITSLDVENVHSNCEDNLDIPNRRILHSFPLMYKLEGKEIQARPEGLRGVKLEAKMLFITCLKQNIEDLISVLTYNKIIPEEITASPLALSSILLNNKQKIAGCVLVDIGHDTISSIVFENNLPVSLQVFPIGGMCITKDIALGLKVSLEEAEAIKMGNVVGGDYSEKKVNEIIEARLEDIFELIDNQLKKIKRSELLPAGIILTGGSSSIKNIEEIARRQLKLPTTIGSGDVGFLNKYKVKDNSWYTALALALMEENYSGGSSGHRSNQNIKEVKRTIKSFFSQLLP